MQGVHVRGTLSEEQRRGGSLHGCTKYWILRVRTFAFGHHDETANVIHYVVICHFHLPHPRMRASNLHDRRKALWEGRKEEGGGGGGRR